MGRRGKKKKNVYKGSPITSAKLRLFSRLRLMNFFRFDGGFVENRLRETGKK